MSLNKYEYIRKVGEGVYGKVWLVVEKGKCNRKYVVKAINLSNSNKRMRDSAIQECHLLRSLNHPNIVEYHDSWEDHNSIYLVMTYCEIGDLYTTLKARRRNFYSEKQVCEWFIQITMALSYLHERNVLHRDLKTQNIFLAKSSIIKVGDLGIAKQLTDKTDMAMTMIGTPYYMSPELFAKKPYNFKSDIWSLGCVVYEIATLKHAFSARNFNNLSYKILNGQVPEMPHMYSSELTDLIQAMLQRHPENRPSSQRILRNPYITRHIQNFLDSVGRDKSAKQGKRYNDETDMISQGKKNVQRFHRNNPSVPHEQKKEDEEEEEDKTLRDRTMLENKIEEKRKYIECRDARKSEIEVKNKVNSPDRGNIKNIKQNSNEKEPKMTARQRKYEKNRQEGHLTIKDSSDSNLEECIKRNRRRYNQFAAIPDERLLPKLKTLTLEDESDDENEEDDDEDEENPKEVSAVLHRMKDTLQICNKHQNELSDKKKCDVNKNQAGPTEHEEETFNRNAVSHQQYESVRKELMKNLGYEKLKAAYKILENMDNNHEEMLKEMLQQDYNSYNSKMYWLYLYETNFVTE